ncbi:MAG TPA: hypothetical protein ENG83_15230 [Nitrospirae bacterium]|nr:hypothetical protein BMS3Abin06_00916 [bacterium BMS3Abin06]HDH13521.1 hypothetical protein [Nitrospirota bacterium]HDZ01039.1 hypothetical protein [Nitrospirota bacterium]
MIVADYINKLLGKEFTKRFSPIPVIDDRMFVVCWFGSDSSSNRLKEKKKTDGAEEMAYNSSNEWYKFIFVDGKDIGCASERMKRELIKSHTYDRWVESGTFFGITRYSLMCITNAINPENSFPEILRRHMERMYYQIAIILFAQRASILKFSDDVASLSSRIRAFIQKNESGKNKKTEDFENIAQDVKELHASYIRFVNRYGLLR